MSALTSNNSSRKEDKVNRLAASSKVPANTPVSKASVFSDPVWDMSSTATRKKGSSFDFESVPGFPGGFALDLAEFAYHRLYAPVITHDREGAWPTVYNELTSLRQVAKFCAKESYLRFCDLDSSVIERLIARLTYLPDIDSSKQKHRTTKFDRTKKVISHVRRLWEYRSKLSEPLKDTLFEGSINNIFEAVSGDASGENKTPPIPEYIFGPLTGAAIDYVLQYSETILLTYKEVKEAVKSSPGYDTLSHGGASKRKSRIITSALKKIASPWRKTNWNAPRELYLELNQLRRACIIIILAFSGMRSSEILEMEAGCCVADKLDDGRIRYYINTLLRKHRGNGSRDTWVVIEEVKRAVEILEELTLPLRTATGEKRLLISSGTNSSYFIGNKFEFDGVSIYSNESLVEQINTFVRNCNRDLARPAIPVLADINGVSRPWSFNCRQFRRTLARYIARQPFGIIAGMVQYKHVSAACFEGYAGSEPEWNKMLSQEKVLASVNILEEVAIDLSNGAIAGEFSSQIKAAFEKEFHGRVEDFPPSQIAKWLTNREKTLFVGKFNFCFFDSSKALCIKESAKTDRPILNSCDPANCKNACVSKRHLPLWNAQLKQATELMRHPKSSTFQRDIITQEIHSLKKVIATINK